MNTSLKERYLAHYVPLIRDFVREVEDLTLEIEPKTPQPFFPLFGEAYERSSLRMAIVGQDTKGWGCLKSFIEVEKTAPGSALEADLEEFQARDFTAWATTRYTFWGFAMMFLAALHGRSDWGVMKHGACTEILSSFVWGNGNAIEYFESSPKHMPWEKWEMVRKAGERFNGLRHLMETVRPRVVVVLWKDVPAAYFAGYDYTRIEECDGVAHFHIPTEEVDIFCAPHPGRMRWEGIPAEHFCAQLVAQLHSNNLTVAFPAFVQSSDAEDVIAYLRSSSPTRGDNFNKFQFVEWVAEELKKRGSFMSAPTLAHLLNDLGYRTDYDSEYAGARGIFNLISGTYQRLDRAGKATAREWSPRRFANQISSMRMSNKRIPHEDTAERREAIFGKTLKKRKPDLTYSPRNGGTASTEARILPGTIRIWRTRKLADRFVARSPRKPSA